MTAGQVSRRLAAAGRATPTTLRQALRPALPFLLLVLLLASGPAHAASRVLPGLQFRVLRTPHFRIYYHQSEERLARQLAGIAESVHASVPGRLGLPAPKMTHVLLVDQDDASNGWASPLPYDTVMVTAGWPAASELIGNTNEWLRMVFTHEFTHILQLDQSRGWARAVRAVFGRAPLAFPNLFLPLWQVEGMATFEETRETGQGRLAAGDALAVVRDRIREAGPERLDRVNGGQVEWPGGVGPYLYGGFFTDYLAKRFGEAKLGELTRRTAGRLPFFGAPAYRATFGQGLGELWADYQRSLAADGDALASCQADESTARLSAAGLSPAPRGGAGTSAAKPVGSPPGCRRLTRNGFFVATPRFTPDGAHLVYSLRTPHDFPALMTRAIAGEGEGRAAAGRRLAVRYGGEQLSVSGGIVYFDQADYRVNVAWRSDLFAAEWATGRVQRLTRDARLLSPDVSADGRLLACIQAGNGARRLRVFRVEGARVGELRLTPAPLPGLVGDAVYGSPRWSPDGKRLAVERRLPGGPSEIVVIDAASGEARVAAATATGRNLTPAWLPEGHSLLFASDQAGGVFQIYAVRLDTGETRRVLAVAGGALSPEISPDGRRLVYVGYTAAGYDLFAVGPGLDLTLPERVAPGGVVPPGAAGQSESDAAPRAQAGESGRAASGMSGSDPVYQPWYTLLPRAWSPAADTANGNLRLGVSTGGIDVLGRHAFGATALWRVQGGSDATFGPHRGRPDWYVFYTYDRWRPTFFVTGSDETSFLPQFRRGVRVPDAELREQNASVGLSVPFFRLRLGQLWQTAFNMQRHQLSGFTGVHSARRNSIQTAWAFNSAHVFGFSVGPEQGVSIGVTSEQVRSALGADGDADAFTGEVRGYLRLGGRHSVLAVRAGLGAAGGETSVARIFYLGGPEPAGSLIDFGSGAFSMLRGYQTQAFAGSHIGVANIEYRFPLWRIERGRGTWPLFLRTVHGAVFADAGQVWDRRFTWAGAKLSVGAELSLDAVVGFGLPLSVSAGVARPRQPTGTSDIAAYVRVGRAF